MSPHYITSSEFHTQADYPQCVVTFLRLPFRTRLYRVAVVPQPVRRKNHGCKGKHFYSIRNSFVK